MWQNRRVVKRRAAACAGTLLVAALFKGAEPHS